MVLNYIWIAFHASLSELRIYLYFLLANKTLNSYGAQLYLDCLLQLHW